MNFNSLYLGDCLEILPTFEPKSIDFTITSPPFKTYHKDYEKENEIYYPWLDKVLTELRRVTKEYIIMFNSSTRMVEISKRFNPHRIMIWYKGIINYSYRYEPIFIFKTGTESFKINKRIWGDTFKFQPIHKWSIPYENPVELYEAIVKMITKKNDIILDPFIGSGTLALAAKYLNRKWIGIEKNEDYYNLAKKRIESSL